MMYFSILWGFVKQSIIQYVLFLPLDLWAKSALRHSDSEAERRHIWASEAQLIIVACFVAYFWYKVYPVVWVVLAFFCYRSARVSHRKLSSIDPCDNDEKNAISSQVYSIWFSFSVFIGDVVSHIFKKLKWNNSKELAAESLLLSIGSFISKCFSFIFTSAHSSTKWLYKNCLDWEEMFRSNQWDTYQCVSQEQYHGPPPDVSSDKLLCHPECELSQRSLCRTSVNVNGSHLSQEESVQVQSSKCNTIYRSTIKAFFKGQFLKLLTLLKRIFKSFYYCLTQCQKIRLLPYSSEISGQNLCFMNTVLQCFTQEPSLMRFLQETVNIQTLARLNIPAEEEQFLQTIHQLITLEKSSEKRLKQFSEACSVLVPTLIAPPGSRQSQQDVGEFTQWLLNKLHCCFMKKDAHSVLFNKNFYKGHVTLNGQPSMTVLWRPNWLDKTKSSIIQPSDSLMKTMQQYAVNEWLSYRRDSVSPITNNFTGQMLDCFQCIMCNQISVQSQTFTILPLALPMGTSPIFLQDVIKQFLHVEDMEVSEGCSCNYNKISSPVHKMDATFENSLLGSPTYAFSNEASAKTSTPLSSDAAGLYECNSQILSPIKAEMLASRNQTKHLLYTTGINRMFKKTWFKRTFISRAPKFLIFQLMRFHFDKKNLTKNHRILRIPLYNLCIPVIDPVPWDYKIKSSSKEYELCALIVHLGAKSLSCGHYVAYVRSSEDPAVWSKHDDNLVSMVPDIHREIDSTVIQENAYLLFYKQTKFGG